MNQDIYQTLKERIIHLEYEPGTILKEQTLAGEFGVSRTPLRTVLFRLEWEHLVKILPRTGILVMELELNTITHVFQARLEIEEVIGTLAAERFTPEDLSHLATLHKECQGLIGNKDPRRLGAADMEIKQTFNLASGNPFLIEMAERLYSLTFRLWYFNMIKMDIADWNKEAQAVTSDLSDLLDVLKTDTPAQAGQLRKDQLLTHLKRIRSRFLGLTDF